MRTAETVRKGHPDKVCDIIADAIVDEALMKDPKARCAIEVTGGHGEMFITGESTLSNSDLLGMIAKQTYRGLGYHDELEIMVNVANQSREIAAGVNHGGAGDSGIVTGYATSQTQEMIPLELVLARRITHELDDAKYVEWLGPDGKAQVTLDKNHRVHTVVISAQHKGGELEDVRNEITNIAKMILREHETPKTKYIVNPAGPFTIGGFEADAGTTGRKIVQDNYGPRIPVGGGAYSGKDATKVDRSGAYYARKLAMLFVQEEGYDDALITLAFAIGINKPVMSTALLSRGDSREFKSELVSGELTVEDMIDRLELREPRMVMRTVGGHYGVLNL